MSVLAFESVTKQFGGFTAVDRLSFAVPEGGIFGFLGGNGAGKTTSLRMALDILRPTAGRVEILGRAPNRDHAGLLGFLPEERGLYRQMSVTETLVYFGRLKGMTEWEARKAAAWFIERFGLGQWTRTTIEKLSKGLSQKVQLAAALINRPKLLLLDEPFSGLDPVNQSVLEEVILEMARGGATIIFSTHIMQHAERLCENLLLLSHGRKIFEGTPEEARKAIPPRLTLTSRINPSGLPHVAAVEHAAGAGEWVTWQVSLTQGSDPADLLEAATTRGFALRAFETHTPSLHDVFIHLVGEKP
jgi:ABC-2 type transport system ATP-binding protein